MRPQVIDLGYGRSLSPLWPWGLRLLQASVLCLPLLGLGLVARAAAVPQPAVHVYLLRGVLNIFSLGLDQIGARLDAQGIANSVNNYLSWSSLADEAALQYKNGRLRKIILVGHSSGATVLPDMVARLSAQHVPVALAIGLDSVFQTSLSGTVGRYLNFYIANGAGTPVERTRQLHGDLENINVGGIPGIGHVTIDKNQIIQQKVINAIDAEVFGRPAAVPAQ